MKGLRLISFMIIFIAFSALCACSEGCEHQWNYTNNGESGHTAVCSLCGESHSDAHNLTSSQKGATCQSPAITTYECTKCSYRHSFTEGEKNDGHAWSEYSIIREATCRQSGLQSRTCPDCGQVESIEIEQLEHNYGEWKQHDEKWHIRYCKVCDWAYKGSHRLDDGEIIVQPTESQLGIIRYTCRVCDETFENILRIDGAIYSMDTVDVLGNGTSYLLAASKDEENSFISEIILPGGTVDLRPAEDSEPRVYASAKTGNYAGISIESGKTALDIIPSANHEIVDLEFLLLKKDASADIRIFNASGAFELQNLDGPRVIIAQQKNPEGKIVTLFMRITEKRDSVEMESEIHLSDGAMITITNKNGSYAFTLPENAQKIASVTFKYQRMTGKITVNPRNHENNPNGTSIYILEGIEFLRSAENTKTAETYVMLSDDSNTWRLRATFPMGFTLETPLFRKDGSYAGKTNRYLMDEQALGALMLIDPSPEIVQEETPELELPASPIATNAPISTETPSAKAESTPIPTPPPVFIPVEEAELLPEETISLYAGDSSAFACREYPSVIVQYSAGRFFVHQSGDADGWELASVTLVQQGAAFKILNAYTFPAEIEISNEGNTISIRAQLKNGKETKEVSLGTYTFHP